MGPERREHPRYPVFAGNAEITAVFGRGRRVRERARIVNWSRGGVLLRVPSPRRKLLFLKNEPALYEQDAVSCTVRLAPAYNDLEVHGEVVYAAPETKDPDHLLVGLRFDPEQTPARSLQEMIKVLEPKSRSGRVRKVSGRVRKVSGRTARVSARLAARASGRAGRASRRVRKQSPGA
ncbi:MAG: PilZ domain-containing protein [Planctomycetota bacterium]|nr:MAG: PilZ domain-containing protein [Planctomycetota bacterium]